MDFIKNLPLPLIIGVASFIAVLILFLVIFILVNSTKRIKDRFKKLNDSYNLFQSQLVNSCYDMIIRIKSLAQYSRTYEMYYYEKIKRYEDLEKKTAASIADEINSMKESLNDKKYKELKTRIISYEGEINEFGNSVAVLNNDLKVILKEDIEVREASLPVKEKYRTIKEFYNSNINDLKPLEKSFNRVFEMADKLFAKYDSLVDHAQFQDAKEHLQNKEKILDAVLAIINELPTLANLIYQVIPNKIDQIIDEVQVMVKEKFVLDNLNIPKFVNSIRDELKKQEKKLEVFEVFGIDKILKEQQDKIIDMELKLQNEKSSRDQFQKDKSSLAFSSYEIQKKYNKYYHQLESYRKAYVLDQKKIEKLIMLRTDVDAIDVLKRELEAYLADENQQPYSVISERVNKMQEEINKVEETIGEFGDYLEKLKGDIDLIYNKIRELFIEIKQNQYTLRSVIGIKALSDIYQPRIKALLEGINEIDALLHSPPVDVYKVYNLFLELNDKCSELFKNIKKEKENCEKAEASILYANTYRIDFADTRNSIDRAERYFIEGDFEKSSNEALRVLDSFK